MEVSDLELVRAAADGDDDAFHALLDRHAPSLFRAALALSRNRADAEDVVQDTLVAAHRGLRSFEGRSSVRTWLLRILTRRAFRLLRRARYERAAVPIDGHDDARDRRRPDGAPAGSPMASSVEARLDVTHVLRSMSPPHSEILMLREIQGLSYDEIAAALGVPRGTVESRLFRARAEFRRRFGEDAAKGIP